VPGGVSPMRCTRSDSRGLVPPLRSMPVLTGNYDSGRSY
jgi:hypothetical protein